jgi:hypothetical protein
MTVVAKETFVPLSVGPSPKGTREDFRVLMAERPETARPLRESDPVSAGPVSGQHRTGCEPRVTLQKESNVITAIRIECSCGQIIDLKCSYQDSQAPPAQA